jgi:hypothetical protein
MQLTCLFATHDALEVVEKVVEGDENKLSLKMGVLRQVSSGQHPSKLTTVYSPPGQTLLGSETLLDTVDISQTWQHGLEVKLTTLSQVSLGAVVVELEQGRTTLDRSLDHTWGSDLGNSSLIESFSERSEEKGSESHTSRCGLTSKFEMSEIGSLRVVHVLNCQLDTKRLKWVSLQAG